jgi:hypothetical protein
LRFIKDENKFKRNGVSRKDNFSKKENVLKTAAGIDIFILYLNIKYEIRTVIYKLTVDKREKRILLLNSNNIADLAPKIYQRVYKFYMKLFL